MKKLMLFVFSIFLLSVIVFYVSRLAPGDPLISYYGDRVEKMSPVEKQWAEEKLGLRDPMGVQYIRWLNNALHGDFGISYKYKMDAAEVIRSRLSNTLILGGTGFVLIFVFSLLLGILCAWREDGWLDRVICKLGTIISCIPEFWLALVLILVFALKLGWLPSSGAYSIGKNGDLWDRIVHLILPLSVVVISHLWYYAYMVRNRILEEVRADYVLLARSKGLNKRSVMFRHCLRNGISGHPHCAGGDRIQCHQLYSGEYEKLRRMEGNRLHLRAAGPCADAPVSGDHAGHLPGRHRAFLLCVPICQQNDDLADRNPL